MLCVISKFKHFIKFQQAAFEKETSILWNAATSSGKFIFKSIEDIVNENEELKSKLDYYKGIIDKNLTEILNALQSHESDIKNLQIRNNNTSEEVASKMFPTMRSSFILVWFFWLSLKFVTDSSVLSGRSKNCIDWFDFIFFA